MEGTKATLKICLMRVMLRTLKVSTSRNAIQTAPVCFNHDKMGVGGSRLTCIFANLNNCQFLALDWWLTYTRYQLYQQNYGNLLIYEKTIHSSLHWRWMYQVKVVMCIDLFMVFGA